MKIAAISVAGHDWQADQRIIAQRGHGFQRHISGALDGPMLGSRSGLSTADEPMANVAAKLAELATL